MAVDSYIQFSLAPGAPRIFARTVQTVEFRTINAQLFALITLLNRDDSVQTPVTIGQPAADAACVAAGFLPFSPAIGFFNPFAITHYEDDGTLTTINWTSNKTDRYASAAVIALFSWTPPSSGVGVFEVGTGADSVQQVSVGANAFGQNSFAFGNGASSVGGMSFAFGASAQSNGQRSFAFGTNANSFELESFAFGFNAQALGLGSFAFGSQSQAAAAGAVVFGNNATAGHQSFVFGQFSNAGNVSIAMGNAANAANLSSIALGQIATAGVSSIAIGFQADGTGMNAVAVGAGATAAGIRSLAFTNGVSFANNGIAFQNSIVQNPHTNSVAMQGRTSARANCVHLQSLDIAGNSDIFIAAVGGTRIGQSTSRISFFGATPITVPAVSTGDTTQTQLNNLRTALVNLGLITTIA